MEVQGRIKLIGEIKTFGANGFRKREVIVTTDEQYPQHLLIEFTQDKCELLDRFSPDDQVRISINLRGREWTNPQGEVKYFNSIQGWRIEDVTNTGTNVPPPPSASDIDMITQVDKKEEDDDLPF